MRLLVKLFKCKFMIHLKKKKKINNTIFEICMAYDVKYANITIFIVSWKIVLGLLQFSTAR